MRNRKLWVSILAGLLAFIMLFGLIAGVLPTRADAASSGVLKEQLDELKEDKKKIQDEMTYPGQVKITVIRETRAVNYAR